MRGRTEGIEIGEGYKGQSDWICMVLFKKKGSGTNMTTGDHF